MITDEYILTVDNIFREVEFIDSMVGGEIGEGNKEEILRRIGKNSIFKAIVVLDQC